MGGCRPPDHLFIRGDSNSDGKLNIADACTYKGKQHYLGKDPQKAMEKLRGLVSGEGATSSRKIGDLVKLGVLQRIP